MRAFFPNFTPKEFLYRFLSSVFIIAIIAPVLFVGYYWHFWGRIISFGVLAFILFYSLYEIFVHFQSRKIFAAISALLGFLLFLLPSNFNLNEIYFSKDAEFSWSLIKFLLKEQFSDYHIFFTLPFLIVIRFMDSKQKTRFHFFSDILLKFIIIFIVTLFFKFLWILNTFNVFLVISLGSIAVISDIFGYIFGSIFGRKIFPWKFDFSPKKSMEGFIFSFIFSLIFTLLIFLNLNFGIQLNNWLLFKILAVIFLPIVAIFGDIFFSVIKRYLNIKDFSQIIKGHGGIFDRFDSISFVFLSFSIIILTI
ncbi:phosphatidate cytidylyltransferase [Mesomycoplasma ovipneumoniae]|uniref:phosphatidate cytidylyltransferase n=1 Tax=Mesomycoplasma ovipneumoniae TaxID=29562 RepID=UPI00083E7B85|nr:phosphatidate cytidylyltransferase [Mesomycoplasma ovipneumoniae]